MDGVSPLTWTMSFAVFASWAAFALSIQYWELLAVNAMCLIGATVVITIGTRSGWSRRWAYLSLGSLAVVITVLIVDVRPLVAVIAVGGIAIRVPQMFTLLRSPSVIGVSVMSLVASVTTVVLWSVIAIARDLHEVLFANILSFVGSLMLIALLLARRIGMRPVLAPNRGDS